MKSPAVTADVLLPADDHLTAARQAFATRQWGLAYSLLTAAQNETGLMAGDLELLARSASILGKDAEGSEILARAHKGYLDSGETLAAVRCSIWLAFTLLVNGEMALAGGWLGRAARLLENEGDCVEKGYILLPEAFRHVHGGNPAKAYELFERAAKIGKVFNDIDLTTLSLNGQGRALIRHGDVERGVALLDEAMVAVMADEVSPLVAGGTYCSVIEGCSEIFDLRRAQEWTNALDRWCATQPDHISYHGHCVLRRAELLQLHGEWEQAESEAVSTRQRSSDSGQTKIAGSAHYRLGELHRLRGEFQKAEEFYELAAGCGVAVQPGLARLRLSQGQIEHASGSIRSVVNEIADVKHRSILLESLVEIMLEADDITAASVAADELASIADTINAPMLHAIADRAIGSVRLAKGETDEAIELLWQSLKLFREIGAPYDEACVRCLIAQAFFKRGDTDTAAFEAAAARNIFVQLGAIPNIERIDKFPNRGKSGRPATMLTPREVEVIKLVALGKTNRDIAGDLFISEKTVARHISNIFDKLDLSSRAAATAYAFKNQLV